MHHLLASTHLHHLYHPGNSEKITGTRGFNLAESDAVSSHLEDQTDRLIAKLRRSTHVDMSKDWKVDTYIENK